MEIFIASLIGIFCLLVIIIQGQQAEQALARTKNDLTGTSDVLNSERKQRQQAQQFFEQTKRDLTSTSKLLNREQKQRQQAQLSLGEFKRDLTSTSEQLNRERKQHQQSQLMLEQTKRDLTTTYKQLTREQKQRQQAEQSFDETKRELMLTADQFIREKKQRQEAEQSAEQTQRKYEVTCKQQRIEHDQRQKTEQTFEESKRQLINKLEHYQGVEQTFEEGKRQLINKLEHYQGVEQSFQDCQGKVTTMLEQHEQSLQDCQHQLVTTSEELNQEQTQRKQLEDALEKTKRDWVTNLEKQEKNNLTLTALLQRNTNYSLKSLSSGKFIYVPQGSLKDGTLIRQDNWRNGLNQQWYFQALGGDDQGYYHIFSVRSKKCLDLSSASIKENAKIHQNQCIGADTQKWKLISLNDENRFMLQCKHSGLMLAVSEKTDNIVQYTEQETDNQHWIITEITEQK